jgi:hypothetical protein
MPMTLRNVDILFNDSTAQSTSSPKVRVSFNSAGTILSSLNVSSVTKNTSGDFTVNFASALTDANYCMVGTANARGGHAYRGVSLISGGTPATSSVRVTTGSTGGSGLVGIQEDCDRTDIVIFR